jgi:hypothetical protein
LNIYTHLVKPTNQEAACRLENAIWGEDGSKMVATKEKAIVARGHFSVVITIHATRGNLERKIFWLPTLLQPDLNELSAIRQTYQLLFK